MDTQEVKFIGGPWDGKVLILKNKIRVFWARANIEKPVKENVFERESYKYERSAVESNKFIFQEKGDLGQAIGFLISEKMKENNCSFEVAYDDFMEIIKNLPRNPETSDIISL